MTGLTDDALSEWSARVDQRFEDKLLSDAKSTQGALEHLNWTLDNLDMWEKETGMRLASNNFQRKLYASVANMALVRRGGWLNHGSGGSILLKWKKEAELWPRLTVEGQTPSACILLMIVVQFPRLKQASSYTLSSAYRRTIVKSMAWMKRGRSEPLIHTCLVSHEAAEDDPNARISSAFNSDFSIGTQRFQVVL
jgi:hypothetical protein